MAASNDATISAGALNLSVAALEGVGIRKADLCKEMGFTDPSVLDPHAQLDAKWYFLALEAAVRKCGGFSALLEVGRRFSADEMGLMGYTAQTLGSLREVCEAGPKFMKYWNGSFKCTFHETRTEGRFAFQSHDSRRSGAVYATVVAASRAATFMRVASARPLTFRHATLPIPADGSEQEYRSFFGCPVSFAADEAALVVDAAALDSPLRLSHAGISKRLREDLRAALGGSRRYRWDEAVRGAIRDVTPKQPVSVRVIARRLSISPRTLQRRLAACGTSLRAEKDSVLRDLALSYLADDTVTLVDVGYRLGFASSSALCRACQRWFGAPPSEVRTRLLREADTI